MGSNAEYFNESRGSAMQPPGPAYQGPNTGQPLYTGQPNNMNGQPGPYMQNQYQYPQPQNQYPQNPQPEPKSEFLFLSSPVPLSPFLWSSSFAKLNNNNKTDHIIA
jgi:hypothetical protein